MLQINFGDLLLSFTQVHQAKLSGSKGNSSIVLTALFDMLVNTDHQFIDNFKNNYA